MKSVYDDDDEDDDVDDNDNDVLKFVKVSTFVTNCRNLRRLQRGSNEAVNTDECVTTLKSLSFIFFPPLQLKSCLNKHLK